MTDQIGPTVYVLGAGASAHTGAPLLANFLPAARRLMETRSDLRNHSAFDRIFGWIGSLRRAAYYMAINVDNLEDVFSTLELAKEAQVEGAAGLYADLKSVVLETLDDCTLTISGDRLVHDPVYGAFITTLIEKSERRVKTLRTGRHASTDTVITLNYDVMIDYVIGRLGRGIDYGFTSVSGSAPISLLKLHGSIGWAMCGECGGDVRIVRPKAPEVHLPFARETGQKQVKIRMLKDLLPREICGKCKAEGVFEPLVVPPTWAKGAAQPQMGLVWGRAVEAIRRAEKIIFIGYSLPESDAFIRYLLLLGLAENEILQGIVVVNPDGGGDLQDRYGRLFHGGTSAQPRISFLQQYFSEFVRDDLKRI